MSRAVVRAYPFSRRQRVAPASSGGEAKAGFYFGGSPDEPWRRNTERQLELVAQAFASDRWEVPRMLDAMGDAPDFYFDRISQIHMDTWSNGRVVLLGDAAHCASPLAGNGTSLALVGGYVLAGELASHGDHTTAFGRYENAMREYVQRCQGFARDGASYLLPRSRTRLWIRDRLIGALPYLPGKDLLTRGFQKAVNAVQLEDYDTYSRT
jgi:2-polyprenyl-6-methoxyphenol hydroxylase-like FAD-dependent oxidoreductase